GASAYWNFDEGTGTTIVDGSGNGNDGTFVNEPTWYTAGRHGGAIDFDGGNDYITVPDSIGVNPTAAISVEAWVRSDSSGWNNNYYIVYIKAYSYTNFLFLVPIFKITSYSQLFVSQDQNSNGVFL
ncbi:MAG: hypothetical protein ACC657_03095, partial [Thiohalomonadales bacterium]